MQMFRQLKKKKIGNSVSFWAREKFQYLKFMSSVFSTHIVKQTFAKVASYINFWWSWHENTAVASCSDISIIIYSLRLINEPNFIWIRWSGADILRFEVWFEEFCQTDRDTDTDTDDNEEQKIHVKEYFCLCLLLF